MLQTCHCQVIFTEPPKGRRIAFVEFFQVSDAAAFLEYHYPSIRFQLAHSRGIESELVNVGINYSKDREDDRYERERERDNSDWGCPEVSQGVRV